MIAAEELDLTLAQMPHDRATTRTSRRTTATRPAAAASQTGGTQTARAAAAAKQALLELASTSLGVPVASLSVTDGVVSGGGKTRHLRRAARRQAVQRHDLGLHYVVGDNAGAGGRGLAGHEAGQPVQARRHEPAAGRHPGQGDRQVHLRTEHQGAGDDARPGRAAARSGRLRRRDGAEILSVDESSIKRIAGAKVVRYGDFLGVVADKEYDAIQAAAQLKVKWADPPICRPSGTSSSRCASTTAPGKAPARIAASAGNFDKAFASAATHGDADLYVPLQREHADRPGCCARRRDPERGSRSSPTRRAYSTRGSVKTVLDEVMGANSLPLDRIRVTYYEGSSVVRPGRSLRRRAQGARSCRRWSASRCGSSSCAGTSTAGATTARPSHGTSAAAWTRTATWSRSSTRTSGSPYYSTIQTQQQVTGTAAFSTTGSVEPTISGTQYASRTAR